MAISGVNPKCYILALFVRDDGTRFLLGDDPFEFKDNQLHFQQNTMANDVVEVQGNDGYLLAGQVRRPGTQMFDGYVCNGTNSKEEVEVKRRAFLQFFRRSHFYKVIYVFPNGTAIQRKQGFLVDDPTVQELYQQYPEYHVALNFEDVNYYTYEEDDQGHEIYAKEAIVPLAGGGATGGLIWDNYGVVWEDPWSLPLSISGVQFQILNNAGARAPIDNVKLYGDTYQQTYSGKNLIDGSYDKITQTARCTVASQGNGFTITSTSSSGATYVTIPIPNITELLGKTVTLSYTATGDGINARFYYINSSGAATNGIGNGPTITLPNSLGDNYGIGITFYTSNNSSATYNDIQLEEGSATAYEPYTGGQPAPNPDYPQPIQVVTGEQTVDVTGKNLLDSLNGYVDGYINASGGIGAGGGTNALFDYIAVRPSSNYTLSQQGANVANSGIAYFDANKTFISREQTYGFSSQTYSTPEGCSYVRIWVYKSGGINQAIIENAKLQFEQGSTATAYEPYQSQTYPISLTGKNLFNVSATPTYLNGVSVSGNLTVTATSSGTGKYALYRLVEAKNYVGSKVCVSCSTMHPSSTNDARIEIGLCNADGTSKTPKAYTNNVNVKPSFTVTDDPSKPYIYVALYASYSSSASVGDYVGYGKVMVNRGSTPGTYAAYSPMELCKIGDYQDYIYKSGDDWYVHKATWSYTFDGSSDELWLRSGQSTSTNFVAGMANLQNFAMIGGNSDSCYCNYFEAATTLADNKVILSGYQSGGFRFLLYRFPSTSTVTDLTSFTTWLGNNHLKMVLVLSTPTENQITDTTLIGQLEALAAMKLFIGENNGLVSATEPNLPATLAFDYYTKFTAIGAEWEEGGTKGATIVNVDAIDNTYPVWELTGPATNPTLSVLTTNTTLKYNGTITASQKLVIDMFNKTATLNGTSVIGNISGDFVYMAPGTNRLAYTAGNTDAPDSTIYWQEVVG